MRLIATGRLDGAQIAGRWWVVSRSSIAAFLATDAPDRASAPLSAATR
jgi:hypothetical protein